MALGPRRLLDFEPSSGLATYHSYDEDTGLTYIEEVQDLEPHYQSNLDVQLSGRTTMGMSDYFRAGVKQSWAHVARFQPLDQIKLREMGINIFNTQKCDWTKKKLWKILNSSEGRKYRTGLGRL